MRLSRRVLGGTLAKQAALHMLGPALLLAAAPHQAALAFENRLPPDEVELKYKQPRSPGPKPSDLGPRPGGTLKPCLDGKPHCFSTTPEAADDAEYAAFEGWLVTPFKFDKPLSEAFADVKASIASYPPGQVSSWHAEQGILAAFKAVLLSAFEMRSLTSLTRYAHESHMCTAWHRWRGIQGHLRITKRRPGLHIRSI